MHILFFILLIISSSAYADENYTAELKSIYKQQYELKNENIYLKSRIDKNLRLDAINNTNIRQRNIVRLIEKITKNTDRLEELDNRLNYINQMILSAYIFLHTDNEYDEEIKQIYKRQLQLKNENIHLKGRIDKSIKFDAINNTDTRQRHIVRLIEKIKNNHHQLEELDNRLDYINQIINLEKGNISLISSTYF